MCPKGKSIIQSKGITLVALVITIIVMFIISGVSITLVLESDGIINQAERAKSETEISKEKEQVAMKYVAALEKKDETEYDTINAEDIQREFDNDNMDVTVGGSEIITIKFNETENIYRILTSGKIIGPIDPNAIASWSLTLNIDRKQNDATLQVTVNNLKEENGTLTYKYYVKDLSNSEQEYSLKYKGTDSSYKFEELAYNKSYMLKVVVADELGNEVTGEATAGTWCFLAGTQILTETGLKNIEDIKVGDMVYSLNIDNNQRELKMVTQLFRGETTDIYEITIGNEVIKTTPKHQFYVVDKGWIRAYELEEGDRIVAKDNSDLIITKIEHKCYEEPLKVYNITVEGYHNYLITQYELLVHNAGSPS